MATFFILKHPVTILVTDFTNPNNLTNDLLILSPLKLNKSQVNNTKKGVLYFKLSGTFESIPL